MPDANGNFKGMSVPAAAWDRIFGAPRTRDEQVQEYLDELRDALDTLNRDNPTSSR